MDYALHNTRKNALEVMKSLGYNNVNGSEITVIACTSCNLWQFPRELVKDLDGYEICRNCFRFYGL